MYYVPSNRLKNFLNLNDKKISYLMALMLIRQYLKNNELYGVHIKKDIGFHRDMRLKKLFPELGNHNEILNNITILKYLKPHLSKIK